MVILEEVLRPVPTPRYLTGITIYLTRSEIFCIQNYNYPSDRYDDTLNALLTEIKKVRL